MKSELKKRIITSLCLVALLLLMHFYIFVLIISLIIISIISWIEFYGIISKIFFKKNLKAKFMKFIYKSLSLFYLSFLVALILYFITKTTDFKLIIIYSLLISIASDIGGLVVGKTLKGKKLTKISPKKTISGSIGSFLFSLMLIPFFIDHLLIKSVSTLIFITFLISLTSQIGDLLISYLKRKAKVKNTSDLLPGHGGFLDRIDGIIFVIPISFLLLNYF